MCKVTTSSGTTYEIKFSHPFFESQSNGKQRTTICTISDGAKIFKGISFCHPNDQFDKVEGRKRALRRAIAFFKLDKPERTEIWDGYKKTHRVTKK